MPLQYRLKDQGEFVIYDYNAAKPWASFFPGIAGLYGIPLWAFYVNRGQCIVSCGIRSKDEAIMEYLPANKAYQLAPTQGFRTFIKVKNKKGFCFCEPFSPSAGVLDPRIKNKMTVSPHALEIEEENPPLGLKTRVSYFPVVGEPFAGLVRELTIENTLRKPASFELMDGLGVIIPAGVNNWCLKEMSRTIEAWMGVDIIGPGLAVYKVTTDPSDTAQVAFVKEANFYASFQEDQTGSSKTTQIVVDPAFVFGEVTDLTYPAEFAKSARYAYPRAQIAKNKTPCAFTFLKKTLAPGASLKLYSMIGHVFDVADIKKVGLSRLDAAFIAKKRKENELLIAGVMDRIFTASGSNVFDLYARQTYLDNVLRGGLPYAASTEGKKKTVYVYSRKHGDLERDYNRFSLSPTYFSEGEANYRDVNQNRRLDVFFSPLVAEKNIVDFMGLIQMDGYNPLIFKGDRFTISENDFTESGLAKLFRENDAKKISHILAKPFTLGEVLAYIEEHKVFVSTSYEELVKHLLGAAEVSVEAAFGEGYWSDHWTYNTDLLESFLSVYPDRFQKLLLESDSFTFFDTAVYVKPRRERICLQRGAVRQYHGIATDEEKNALIQKRHEAKHKVRAQNGEGPVFATTLLDKLVCLIANKLATLDPSGIGIEMETDKPNWYDALNGLPGLFGSSVSETFELKRLIALLKDTFSRSGISDDQEVLITVEVFEFVRVLEGLLDSGLSAFDYWDKANSAKEAYRLGVRRGVSGRVQKMRLADLKLFFEKALKKLSKATAQSFEEKGGCLTTYFAHHVTRYETVVDESGKQVVECKEFRLERLPLFLEGFVHAMRTEKERASSLYRAVRQSALWDKKLKMYKVNASLADTSYEVGRTKAFTPGWLENESIWLHMEYKYLLELLKSGLYRQFYDDIATMLVPFQDPKVYGRSILENSSFIASSAHPDASLHGRGFVARLSGSTAEFLHMWLLMSAGSRPFGLDKNDRLTLTFEPVLSAKFFSREPRVKNYIDAAGSPKEIRLLKDTYAFLFLGATLVVYHNPKRKDTFGLGGVGPQRMTLSGPRGLAPEGVITEVKGGILRSPYAEMVRNGEVGRIDIELG